MNESRKKRVVIVGAGFGGLFASKALKNAENLEIVVIDKNNHHLFQPLLYQVAISALSPGDIAFPIRATLKKQKNTRIMMDMVKSIDRENQVVHMKNNDLRYDYLILAPGAKASYFGNDGWQDYAPALKSLRDALLIREKVILAFEKAVQIKDKKLRKKYMTFAIVGGGPTGVEMAGAIAEIGRKTMLSEFPDLAPEDLNVLLIEASDNLLRGFAKSHTEYTIDKLEEMGVKVRLNTMITKVDDEGLHSKNETFETANIVWAAGNQASPLIDTLNTQQDKMGRAIVNKDLTIKSYDNVFVIGDAAHFKDKDGNPLPALAPVAMQQGEYVAKILKKEIKKENRQAFRYVDRGKMATIGRAKAVADIKDWKFSGVFAWLLWAIIHIFFLIGFRNRFRVITEWFWYYIYFKPGAHLIVHPEERKEAIYTQLEHEEKY